MVIFAGNSSSYTYDSMGNLLQMSITSGQGADSRQLNLATASRAGNYVPIFYNLFNSKFNHEWHR